MIEGQYRLQLDRSRLQILTSRHEAPKAEVQAADKAHRTKVLTEAAQAAGGEAANLSSHVLEELASMTAATKQPHPEPSSQTQTASRATGVDDLYIRSALAPVKLEQ